MMLERGVQVSYETIRRWCAKFGQAYANRLRRRRARPGGKWYLDEVFTLIIGTQHYLWRAVDRHGNVLDVLVQSRRNAVAAKRFFCKLLKGLRYVPRVIIIDKLSSYPSCWPRWSIAGRRFEQSSRELASTHKAAGTCDEALHIARARATIPICFLGNFTAFSAL